MQTVVALALLTAVWGVHSAPWCGEAKITGYVRGAGNPHTFDGTSIYTGERIVAASWDVVMGAQVVIDGLAGSYRVADRGRLGYGSPTWIDVAVWSYSEAYALTSTRWVCIGRASNERD